MNRSWNLTSRSIWQHFYVSKFSKISKDKSSWITFRNEINSLNRFIDIEVYLFIVHNYYQRNKFSFVHKRTCNDFFSFYFPYSIWGRYRTIFCDHDILKAVRYKYLKLVIWHICWNQITGLVVKKGPYVFQLNQIKRKLKSGWFWWMSSR